VRKGEALAARNSPEDPPPVWAWRPSARRRVTVSALTLLAVGLAIAVVAAGPPEPVTYAMRLPLLVLAGGALVNATQWRRGVRITPDEVVLRTLVRVRRIPLPGVARVETDDSRVTIRTLSGRKVVVRALTSPSAADHLAIAVVTAAGPAACLGAGTPSAPVPIATPWLLMLATVGIALLAARGFAVDPVVVGTALSAGAAVSCALLGSIWLPQHRERNSEPAS
jgi:Bacterial PH domain